MAGRAAGQLLDRVTANQPPTASFTTSTTNLVASVDGTGTYAVDGTVTSYAWNWGDRAWLAGATQPSTWLQTTTDSTAGLQGTGVVGFVTYASGSATSDKVLRCDNLTAKAL